MCLTFENWIDIALEMIASSAHIRYANTGIVLYYVTYLVLVGYILMSVVIAVMLERFMLANAKVDQDEKKRQALLENPSTFTMPLQPLLEELCNAESPKALAMSWAPDEDGATQPAGAAGDGPLKPCALVRCAARRCANPSLDSSALKVSSFTG